MSWLDERGLRGSARQAESRMRGYWEARVAGDLEALSNYLHPMQTQIVQPGMLVTEAYEIHGVAVDGERATASVKVRSRLKHPVLSAKVREVELQSSWIKYEGQWYLEPQPIGLADSIRKRRGEWVSPIQAPESE